MKKLFAFIVKEIKHIQRDSRTLIILIGMPIVLVTLFGFAVKNEINDAKIVIVNHAGDPLSQQLVNKLVSSNYFIVSRISNDESVLGDTFRKGEAKVGLIISPDFENNFYKNHTASIHIVADAADPNTANTLINYAQAIIHDFEMDKNKMSDFPFQIKTEIKMLYNPTLKSVVYFVPGVMTIILMLISAMMTSITITKEKEMGTMEIMLASPLNPGLIIIGKIIPYIGLAAINAATIIALGIYVFGMPVMGSFALLSIEVLLFIFTSLALGVFISTISGTQQVAMMISLMGLMLPSILLSGFIFPIENMPLPLQLISNIIPAKWFVIIVRGIMVKGIGLHYLWKETLVLILMTLGLILVSIRKFKIRLA